MHLQTLGLGVLPTLFSGWCVCMMTHRPQDGWVGTSSFFHIKFKQVSGGLTLRALLPTRAGECTPKFGTTMPSRSAAPGPVFLTHAIRFSYPQLTSLHCRPHNAKLACWAMGILCRRTESSVQQIQGWMSDVMGSESIHKVSDLHQLQPANFATPVERAAPTLRLHRFWSRVWSDTKSHEITMWNADFARRILKRSSAKRVWTLLHWVHSSLWLKGTTGNVFLLFTTN